MFNYGPTVSDNSGQILAQGQIGAASTKADTMKGLGKDIGGALAALGGMYGQYRDKKDLLAGMDRGVGFMSDIGAIQPDIRDKFINLDNREKPFVFDLLRQGMFAPFAAGQSAGFQAKAWDQYKSKWGAGASPNSANNKYGYVYQGP